VRVICVIVVVDSRNISRPAALRNRSCVTSSLKVSSVQLHLEAGRAPN
jgi:hypothetical protein